MMHGYGKFQDILGNVFKGNYKDNKIHGNGALEYFNGAILIANWDNDQQEGDSVLHISPTLSVEVIWKKGKIE